MSLGVNPRSEPETIASSPTGTLVRQSQQARSRAEQARVHSRRMIDTITATQEDVIATFVEVTERRFRVSDRQTTLSHHPRSYCSGTTRPSVSSRLRRSNHLMPSQPGELSQA